MNTSVTVKHMNTVDMHISDFVPVVGEIIMDETTKKLKVGDGVTELKDLQWVDFGFNLSTEPPRKYKMSNEVKNFIEEYIDLIEEHRFDEVYAMINHSSIEFTRDFTIALLEANLNPKPYLTTIPRCIQDLLLDKVDNVDNKTCTQDYVNYAIDARLADLDARLEIYKQQIAKACGIPNRILKVGGLD